MGGGKFYVLIQQGRGGEVWEGRGSMTAKGSESTLILFKLIIFCEISPRGSRFFRI